jgi:hypothetical protein
MATGCISDFVMDEWGIPRSIQVGSMDKEDRTLCRQRCTILNSEIVLQRIKDDKKKKKDAAEEVERKKVSASDLAKKKAECETIYRDTQKVESEALTLEADDSFELPPNPLNHNRTTANDAIKSIHKAIYNNRVEISKTRTDGDVESARASFAVAKAEAAKLPALLSLVECLPNNPAKKSRKKAVQVPTTLAGVEKQIKELQDLKMAMEAATVPTAPIVRPQRRTSSPARLEAIPDVYATNYAQRRASITFSGTMEI